VNSDSMMLCVSWQRTDRYWMAILGGGWTCSCVRENWPNHPIAGCSCRTRGFR